MCTIDVVVEYSEGERDETTVEEKFKATVTNALIYVQFRLIQIEWIINNSPYIIDAASIAMGGIITVTQRMNNFLISKNGLILNREPHNSRLDSLTPEPILCFLDWYMFV